LTLASGFSIRIALAATDSNGPEKKIGKTILQLVVADVNDHTPEIRIDIIAFSKNNIGKYKSSTSTFRTHKFFFLKNGNLRYRFKTSITLRADFPNSRETRFVESTLCTLFANRI